MPNIDDIVGGSQSSARNLGLNHPGIRAHNERLVLSLIRHHGSLSKADLSRHSGLSAQTASVIMRGLEGDALLQRGEPVRGRVGQPSVPMALNEDGVFSIGLKIGRRNAELVLMDFVGRIRKKLTQSYAYPIPANLMPFVETGLASLLAELPEKHRNRVVGIGVAAPYELWNWLDQVNAPKNEMDAWRDFSFEDAIGAFSALPVLVENDATGACSAEHIFGRGREFSDYLYFFVGTFIGGGIVLNGSVHRGRTGNAGALGSMPMAGGDGSENQLIDCASMVVLERMLAEAGSLPDSPLGDLEHWTGFEDALDAWIDGAARGLARASVSACSVLDFEAVMIDGNMPGVVKAALVEQTRNHILDLDLRGIVAPQVIEGEIGRNARALGAASLPLQSRYGLEQDSTRMRETSGKPGPTPAISRQA